MTHDRSHAVMSLARPERLLVEADTSKTLQRPIDGPGARWCSPRRRGTACHTDGTADE